LSKGHRIEALDSVRGIAAFLVVIHHCFLTRAVYSDYFFSDWKTPATGAVSAAFLYTPARIVWAGNEAVTLFYVLSGLVLALPWVENRAPAYKEFATKRLCRLYIPYLVAILAASVLNIALQQRAFVAGASRWVNEMTWTHPVTLLVLFDHIALIGHHATIDGVTHTLVWEMRASLLFPLLMWPIARWGIRGAVAVFACLSAMIVSMQLAYGNIGAVGDLLFLTPHQGLIHRLAFELQWTAYYTLFFVLGIIVARHIKDIREFLSRTKSWLRFTLLIIGLFVFQAHWSHWQVVQEMMVAVGSILILSASLAPGAIETTLSRRLPRHLGRISFSLYLVHVPIILAVTILTRGTLPLALLILIVVPISILAAMAFERLVTAPSAALGHHLARSEREQRQAQYLVQPKSTLEENRV
jgi:peptidoglycan/LPS O-acetylase OafA/YrhL